MALRNTKRYRIFILGAGFSQAAGFPLAVDLWHEVRRRAQSLTGRARMFDDDLESYLQYRQETDGVMMSANDVDFEDFMRFLDIEHFLGVRGSDTWSRDGNEGTIVVKTLIGQILAEKTPTKEELPQVYLKFASALRPSDYVLTFNYDVLLERALDAVGTPYRLFPNRYSSVHRGGAVIDTSKAEVSVLKLHGSIDWFDRTEYGKLEHQRRRAGHAGRRVNPVFAHANELGVTKLIDGPRQPDDPLKRMYRVRDVESLYRKPIMFRATPWLLAPSTLKILYAATLKDFWRGIGNAGILNFGVAIIGYSLPPQDAYARQVVYSIVTNYQETHWDEDIFGMRKQPLLIVDRCDNAKVVESVKERYRFVNWDRAVLYTNGFNEEALSLAFAQP
jgi:SIR2-like domain